MWEMRFRLGIALLATALVALLPAPREARAADPVVVRDTLIYQLYALDGDLLYYRLDPGAMPQRSWMARFHGHLHRARGIPRPGAGVEDRVWLGELGWDRKGRKVFTFGVGRGLKWFAYDLARNRTRRLRGLPAGCEVSWAAVWRRSMAYAAACDRPKDSGTFVMQGRHKQRRRRVREWFPGSGRQAFRDGVLAVVHEGGEADAYVEQWAANGKSCANDVNGSFGDNTDISGWAPSNVWIARGYLTWAMGNPRGRSDFAILGAKIGPGCEALGPVGLFAFTPETPTVRALAVDGRRIFYAGAQEIRSHVLPASPSFDPLPNDDFEHAAELRGDAPLKATGRLAYATVEPGEPLADAEHTLWYAWRPTRSGSVNIWGVCTTRVEGCYGSTRFGVYTGTRPDALTEIPPYDDRVTQVNAVAGETYWIAVGAPDLSWIPDPSYEPFTIHIDPPFPGQG